jgi:hypothetical protein
MLWHKRTMDEADIIIRLGYKMLHFKVQLKIPVVLLTI